MAELATYYLDVDSGRFYDVEGAAVNEVDWPSLFLGQTKTFELHLMEFDTSGEATAWIPYTKLTGLTLGYYFALDNDWIRWHNGQLNTGYAAGPVTTIQIKNLVLTGSKSVLSTGYLVLDNGTDPAETVQYNDVSLAGGVYTFTLVGGSSLTYTYSVDDTARYIDPPLALAIGGDIDATDKDNGVFIITLDGNTESLEEALAEGALLDDVGFEFGGTDVTDEAKLLVQGTTFRARNRRYFTGDAPPRVVVSDFYTKTQADALFPNFTNMYENGVYDWNILINYTTGADPDLVKRNGKIYKCLVNNVGLAPESNPTEWEDITAGGGGGGTDIYVKASAADTTADYLFEKVDNSQFEILNPAGDEQISVKDGGLPQAKVINLTTDLSTLTSDVAANAAAIGAKLDGDWTGLATKTIIGGTEYLIIDIAGVKYKIQSQLFAKASHTHDFSVENGINTPASQ